MAIPVSAVIAALALRAPAPSDAALPSPRADEATYVTWTAGEGVEGCPRAALVEAWIERVLGREHPADSPLRRVTLRVTAAAGAELEATLEISWDDGVEVRRLHGESCRALARATALVVAVALDPLAAGAQALDEDGAAASDAPAAAPGPAAASIPSTSLPPASPALPASPASPASVRWSHRVRAAGGIDYGVLPSVGGLVGLTYGAQRRFLRLEAGIGYRTPTRRDYQDPPTVGGTFQSVAAFAGACPNFSAGRGLGRVELPICLGVELGALRAAGRADTSRIQWSPWVAPTLDATVIVHLHRHLALTVAVGAAIPILRPRYHIDGLSELYRVGPADLRTLLGLEVVIPGRTRPTPHPSSATPSATPSTTGPTHTAAPRTRTPPPRGAPSP